MLIPSSVVTAKPAIRGHLKTGHRDWAKTTLVFTLPKRFQASCLLDNDDLAIQHCRRTVKQRQVMLASNLLRNSRSTLIRPKHGERSREVSLP